MTKITKRPVYSALDNSKPVKDPDLLKLADKNYASTILRYSNLAILYSQLDTNAKTIVGAINELNTKVQPAKYVGETDVVGGVIIGEGLSVTEEGVLSASGTDIITSVYTIPPTDWVVDVSSGVYSTIIYNIPGCNPPHSNVLVIPAISDAWTNTLASYYETRICADEFVVSNGIKLHSIYKPSQAVVISISCWDAGLDINGVLLNPFYSGRKGVQTVTLSRADWNSNNTISVAVHGVTDYSEQIIMPLPATSQANIENNLALQAANIQDAGQYEGFIMLHADNVPTRDLQIQVVLNG